MRQLRVLYSKKLSYYHVRMPFRAILSGHGWRLVNERARRRYKSGAGGQKTREALLDPKSHRKVSRRQVRSQELSTSCCLHLNRVLQVHHIALIRMEGLPIPCVTTRLHNVRKVAFHILQVRQGIQDLIQEAEESSEL